MKQNNKLSKNLPLKEIYVKDEQDQKYPTVGRLYPSQTHPMSNLSYYKYQKIYKNKYQKIYIHE